MAVEAGSEVASGVDPTPPAAAGPGEEARSLAVRLEQALATIDALERSERQRQQALWQVVERYEGILRTLSACRRLARDLDGKIEVAEIGDTVVRVITDELEVAHSSLMVLEEGAEQLRLVAGSARQKAAMAPGETLRGEAMTVAIAGAVGRTFALGEGVAGEAALRQVTIRVDDTLADPRFLPRASPVRVRSLLCIPLVAGGRLLGVLNFSHPEPHFFRDSHVAVLEVFCPIVAHLVAFARLQGRLLALNQGLEQEVERRTAEVRETQADLARRDKLAALGETVSGLAHELNNRLVPVVLYSESLLGRHLGAREAKQLQAIHDSARGLRAIVESLLGFARRKKPRKESVCLNDILDATVGVMKLALQRDAILIRTALDPRLPRTMVDPHQVEQVLLNLLRNAQDAIRERRPAAGVILVSTEHRDGHIRIAVRDNGCGIPDDIRDKIMQPFFTTKAPGEGSGLGLAMSYGILTEHGGDIEVESLPGDTTVTLRFPVVAASGDEAEAGAVRAAGPAPAGEIRPGTRLLLVDDEEFVLEAVRDILDGRVRVDTASSGLEAIQKLSRGEFDVVLSDMRMPGLGGREVYRWLAEHRPGMERRIIFATGDTCDPGTFEFLQQSGATCLTKPFRLDGLLDAIATVTAT